MKWNGQARKLFAVAAWTVGSVALGTASISAQDFQVPPSETAPAGGAPAGAAPGGAAVAEGQVIASVDGEPITKLEVDAALQPQLQGRQVSPQEAQALQQQVVSTLIDSRLVEKYLRENGPEVEPAEVKQTIDQLGEQLQGQQATMDQFLESRGYTEEMLERRIAGSLAWQKLQQQHAANEQQLQQFFEANRQQFQGAEFEEVKPQVLNSYLGALYQGIVEQTRGEAEIEVTGVPAQQPAPAAGFSGE